MKLLMIGSSILKNWKQLVKLDKMSVINNSKCGSTTEYQLKNFDELVLNTNPSVIIWYCGSNDVVNNVTVYSIILNTLKWINKVHLLYPNCKILLLSIIKSPFQLKNNNGKIITFINDVLCNIVKNNKNRIYVNINPYIENNNEPIQHYYKKDNIHLTNSAYKKLTSIVLQCL